MAVKRFVAVAALSLALCAAPTVVAYGDEISNAPPQTPNIENVSVSEANRLISDYNNQVDAYNQTVNQQYNKYLQELENYNLSIDEYNTQVDVKYEQAIKETEEYNESVDEHNAAEIARVAQEEAENAQAIIDAENRNKEIDAENAIEKERVDKINEERQQQYDKDYANYNSATNQTDIKNEQLILNQMFYYDDNGEPIHFNSVGEYNMLPLKSGKIYDEKTNTYLDPPETLADLAAKAVYRNGVRAENDSLKDLEYVSTVTIQNAKNKSGQIFKLYLTHYLITNGQTYTETITFDANDIVTIRSLAYANNAKPLYPNDNYSAFYIYQGSQYLSYYWYQTFGDFEFPPLKNKNDMQTIQDKGNMYIFTYQNGKKYNSDANEIYVTYYYNSRLTCNIPLSEPVLELEEYAFIEHVKPKLIEVTPADLWGYLGMPVKGEYLPYKGIAWFNGPDYLDYLPLLPVEDNVESVTIEENEIPLAEGTIPVIVETRANPVNTTVEKTISGDVTPMAKSLSISKPVGETIEDEINPLAGRLPYEINHWALLNLIFMIVNILLLIAIPRKKEDNQKDEYYYKHHNNIVGVLLAVIAVIAFIFTENIMLPMVLVDSWTILMGALCGGGIVAKFFTRTKKEKIEE